MYIIVDFVYIISMVFALALNTQERDRQHPVADHFKGGVRVKAECPEHVPKGPARQEYPGTFEHDCCSHSMASHMHSPWMLLQADVNAISSSKSTALWLAVSSSAHLSTMPVLFFSSGGTGWKKAKGQFRHETCAWMRQKLDTSITQEICIFMY